MNTNKFQIATECESEPIKNIAFHKENIFFVVGDYLIIKCNVVNINQKEIFQYDDYTHYFQICPNIFTWLDKNEQEEIELLFSYFPTCDSEKLVLEMQDLK